MCRRRADGRWSSRADAETVIGVSLVQTQKEAGGPLMHMWKKCPEDDLCRSRRRVWRGGPLVQVLERRQEVPCVQMQKKCPKVHLYRYRRRGRGSPFCRGRRSRRFPHADAEEVFGGSLVQMQKQRQDVHLWGFSSQRCSGEAEEGEATP